MVSIRSNQMVMPAKHISAITADEAFRLLTTEVERFLTLARSLGPEDWGQPTACTEWTVRDILAHQAGGYASGTGYREMFRQYARLPKPGKLPEDTLNAFQLQERAGRSPEELIEEISQAAPIAAQKWAYQFRALRPVVFPHPVGGTQPLTYLFWIIHSRDTWMHRLDICRATGREFVQTVDHDGRIVALIMQDVERAINRRLAGKAVELDLTGTSGGAWTIGKGEPVTAIQMDALDFAIFASGRYSPDEARQRAIISGDPQLAEWIFKHLLILF